jgi:hypothetical protein
MKLLSAVFLLHTLQKLQFNQKLTANNMLKLSVWHMSCSSPNKKLKTLKSVQITAHFFHE